MRTFLLFGLFPQNEIEEVYKNSKGAIQNAANQLQWNIVRALDCAMENTEDYFTIVNSMYISSFPKGYKKLFIKTRSFAHKPGAKDINLGFFNPYLLSSYFRFFSIKRYFKHEIKKNEQNLVVIYALTLPFAKTCKYLKKINKNVEICAIVPDLPQFMDTRTKRSFFRDKLRDYTINKTYECIPFIDKYILLTESMKDWLHNNNYMVMEGIAPQIKEFKNNNNENKVVIYAGTLNRKYGIIELLNAFNIVSSCDKTISLFIYGHGDSLSEIQKACLSNSQIIYCGNVTQDELTSRIKLADVLVNPRKTNEEFTKYSFPSKTLEYMSYGIPIVAYKLDGIPKEYYNHFILPKDGSVSALAEAIVFATRLNIQERKNYYNSVTSFIRNNKSISVQGERIYEFLYKGKNR